MTTYDNLVLRAIRYLLLIVAVYFPGGAYSGKTEQDDAELVEITDWSFGFNMQLTLDVSKCCEKTVEKTLDIVGNVTGLMSDSPIDSITKIVESAVASSRSDTGSPGSLVKAHEFEFKWNGPSKEGDQVNLKAHAVISLDSNKNVYLTLQKVKVTAVMDEGLASAKFNEVLGFANVVKVQDTKTGMKFSIYETDDNRAFKAQVSTDNDAVVPTTKVFCLCRCGGTTGRAVVSVDKWLLHPEGIKFARPNIDIEPVGEKKRRKKKASEQLHSLRDHKVEKSTDDDQCIELDECPHNKTQESTEKAHKKNKQVKVSFKGPIKT